MTKGQDEWKELEEEEELLNLITNWPEFIGGRVGVEMETERNYVELLRRCHKRSSGVSGSQDIRKEKSMSEC